MEKLLQYMDAPSVLCLAQSKISCTLDILQKVDNPSIWDKFTRRSLSGDELPVVWEQGAFRQAFEEQRAKVQPIIGIVKMMDKAYSSPCTLSLLNVICRQSGRVDHFGKIGLAGPYQETHTVNVLGFLLLEEVEGSVGTTLQEITSIDCLPYLGGDPRTQAGLAHLCLSTLASRVRRQSARLTKMVIPFVPCSTRAVARDLETLTTKSELATFGRIEVRGSLGVDGWSELARALSSTEVRVGQMEASREAMRVGRREDLKTIFESLMMFGSWLIGLKVFWGGFEAIERHLDGDGSTK